MTADPIGPAEPGTEPFEVIHLGGQAAVIVPLAEFLRLRALERGASPAGVAGRRGRRGCPRVAIPGGRGRGVLPADARGAAAAGSGGVSRQVTLEERAISRAARSVTRPAYRAADPDVPVVDSARTYSSVWETP